MFLTSRAAPVLTAAELRAAEDRAAASGIPLRELMERAGAAAAAAIMAFDPPRAAVVLCGPGNNGGDGYVVARHLAAAGVAVTVAAAGPPGRDPARAAALDWTGEVVGLDAVPAAPLIVDALYGTGLSRALPGAEAAALWRAVATARTRIALDVPSGVASDDGALLGKVPPFDLTIAFGALKPAHLLQPSRERCGRIVVADIGLGVVDTRLGDNPPPVLPASGAATHKYTRGHALVIGGGSGRGGAARLAAHAALRVGAGLVTLGAPGSAMFENAARLDAIMLRRIDDAAGLTALLEDARLSAVAIGPGLGSGDRAGALVELCLASGRAAVFDADAVTHFAGNLPVLRATGPLVLTPHEGEFARVFGELPGSKIDRARAAAATTGAVIVLKGADTVIAAPDGRARINTHASPNLATAGSGDVLCGIVAGLLAQGLDAFDAACAAVWLHGDLGVHGGPGLTADDLPGLIPASLAAL